MTLRRIAGKLVGPAAMLAAALTAVWPVGAADLAAGEVAGWVKDDRGMPQMGASVAIVDSKGEIAKRVFTDHNGAFVLEGLFPGEYAVRVSLSRFLPLEKQSIEVASGATTLLAVNLQSLFTSVQLLSPGKGEIRDMSEDWKWALRSAYSTRPALRFLPSDEARETRHVLRKLTGPFGETQAYAELAGGAGVRSTGLANQTDLGTSFAVATSVFGDNNVTLSGNFGYAAETNAPTTAFRTSYRREIGLGTPEVSLTVRQLQTTALADRAFFDPGQASGAAPSLQSFTLGFGDRAQVGDLTTIEYGFLYESINFMNRLDFVSPYAKISRELTPRRKLEVRYASGAPRPDLMVTGREHLRQQVSALGMFPRVALREGQPTVQRTEHVEIAYREEIGKGLIEAAVYQDHISDAAISALTPDGLASGGEVLPDLFSRASTINGGRHEARGYRISYARKIRDRLEAALGYGSTGALAPGTDQLGSENLGDLRKQLKMEQAHIALASLSAELPNSKTRVLTSYQWVSRPSVMGADLYNEFAARSDPGLNIQIRQPLPVGAGLFPGKLELSADLRNLLKAGYVPMQTHDGRTLYLLQAIRSYRGSLSFIF